MHGRRLFTVAGEGNRESDGALVPKGEGDMPGDAPFLAQGTSSGR